METISVFVTSSNNDWGPTQLDLILNEIMFLISLSQNCGVPDKPI